MSETKPTVDLGYPTEAHGRIPAFANIEEEAAFWDTHDFTDFLEESRPVEVTIGPELAARVASRRGQSAKGGGEENAAFGARRLISGAVGEPPRRRRDSSLRSE